MYFSLILVIIAANYRSDANTLFWVDHSEAAERKYVVFGSSNIPPAKDPGRQSAKIWDFQIFPDCVRPGSPADMTHNVYRCRNSAIPHQELRSRFDSVCVGYFSDDLFTLSGNHAPREFAKTRGCALSIVL